MKRIFIILLSVIILTGSIVLLNSCDRESKVETFQYSFEIDDMQTAYDYDSVCNKLKNATN